MTDGVDESLIHLPLMARFAIALLLFLTIPPLCKRIRLPAAVGLLLAGVLLGPSGVHIAPQDGEVANFFADVGKLLLMFFAGLEIDLDHFLRVRNRSLTFGIATFAFPLVAGIIVGVVFGYTWIGALLIGSLLASHTLLGFPIVQELGIVRNEAVTVAIGATVFTDVASLLVLAICIPIHTTGFSTTTFVLQLLQLAIYVPVVLFGLGAAARLLMTRFEKSKEGQFLVVLLSVTVAAIGAEAIHLEGIIGAFLAGLALNRAVKHTQAKEELEFLGNSLFVPMFFVVVGFLINVRVFFETLVSHAALVSSIVLGLIVSKWIAAVASQKLLGYSRDEGLMMWSLSLPQVAATLAAALTAYEAKAADGIRLIDEPVLNSVIVLMVVTSLLGPILTEVFGKRLINASEVQVRPAGKTLATNS
jgi:Kef-type K+ transport system membrane component KefB